MTSNSKTMTLEERIVQSLKDDTLMKLVGDEDAITELVRRAVKEALYQPARVPTTYGRYDEKDSPVVQAARNVANQAAEQLAAELIANLKGDANFEREFRAALAKSIPGVLVTAFRQYVEAESTSRMNEAVANLENRIRNGEF